MAKSVQDVMTPGVASVERSTTVIEAARWMRSEDVGSLPVVDREQRLVGIVTDRDIAVRAVADGKDPRSTTIGEICSGNLVTIGPESGLEEAMQTMARHQIRRLPVVDESNQLVGMLSQADVALVAKEKDAGAMLEHISEPLPAPRA